jgi:hypothetical protein
MAFIIGGHPRSGTTLLFQLCRDHPQIGITGEFRSFLRLDVPFDEYYRSIETDWIHFSFYRRIGRRAPFLFKLGSGLFLARFRRQLRRIAPGNVAAVDVERALQAVLRRTVVGDKYPGYVFQLPALVGQPKLARVIIYRDARDVVSSFMKMVRTKWKGLPWAEEFQSIQDAARQWVRAVDAMEKYRESLLLVRYEDLVRRPEDELQRLGDYLHVDPAGFRAKRIHDKSIGKFGTDLSDSEVEAILDIAGPAMQRLGYQ